MKTRIRPTGFTLFELVVAVAVFAVMGAIAYPGLTQMAKTGQAVNESNQRISDLQFAMAYMSRDWLQVSPRGVRNRYGDEEPNIVLDDDGLAFTRGGRSNLLQQKRSRLQRVRYFASDGKLIRQYWKSLDQGIGEEPHATVLLEGVESFEASFLDGSERTVYSWPPVDQSRKLDAVALRLSIDLEDFGVITRILEIPGGAL